MNSGEVDCIIVWGLFDMTEVLEIMESSGMVLDDNVKNLVLMLERAVLKPIIRLMKKHSIPVYFCGPFPYKYEWYQKFISHDIPTFDFWDAPTRCLKVLHEYSKYRKEHSN
jgi:hypothetical protein